MFYRIKLPCEMFVSLEPDLTRTKVGLLSERVAPDRSPVGGVGKGH